MAKRITGTLPAATLEQRLASMSTPELMFAARELAKRTDDVAADAACTAVLEALERRTRGSDAFHAFVQEIYS